MAYTGSYELSDSLYYIHKHVDNIGKANNGNNLSDGQLKTLFKQHKLTSQTIDYHKKRFSKKKVSSKGLALIDNCFNGDKILNIFQKKIEKNMEAVMNKENISNMLSTYSTNVAQELMSPNSKNKIKAFNDLLDSFAQVSKILGSDLGDELAVALLQQQYTKKAKVSTVKMGNKLNRALMDFSRRNNGRIVQERQVENVINLLNSLANRLRFNIYNIEHDLEQTLHGIFNMAFTKEIANTISDMALVNLDNTIIHSTLGSTDINIKYTDAAGVPIRPKNITKNEKNNIVFPNISCIVERSQGTNRGNIDITINVNSKFYRKNFFPDLKDSESKDILKKNSLNANYKESIHSLFNTSMKRYLAYNTIAHNAQLPLAAGQLNDLIYTRQMHELFLGKGKEKNFSQLLLINNQVESMAELLQQVQDSAFDDNKKKNHIIASAESGVNMQYATDINKMDNYQRVRMINSKINSSSFLVQLHLDKILNQIDN